MGCMTLLPEELARAEEETGAHLPAHDVAPLIAEQREVAPGVDPILVRIPDHGLRGGADDQLLVELSLGVHDDSRLVLCRLEPVVGHHSTLLGEALDMLRLPTEEGLRDQKGEVGVADTGLLK